MSLGIAQVLTGKTPPHTLCEVYTAPAGAPCEITNDAQARASAAAVLAHFHVTPDLHTYDRFLVACFSDHPLVKDLGELLQRPGHVTGIFQASTAWVLSTPSIKRAVILTSGKEWESLLDEALVRVYGDWPLQFERTRALGLSPLEIANPDNYVLVAKAVGQLYGEGITGVVLGCAALSGVAHRLAADFPAMAFVDGVPAGVAVLAASH